MMFKESKYPLAWGHTHIGRSRNENKQAQPPRIGIKQTEKAALQLSPLAAWHSGACLKSWHLQGKGSSISRVRGPPVLYSGFWIVRIIHMNLIFVISLFVFTHKICAV